MSVYRYDKNSAVNEVVIRRSAGGGTRAFLFAEDNITLDCISGIKDVLSQNAGRCVATEYEGRPCLEVRGVRGIEPLEETLRAGGFIVGNRISTSVDDVKFSPRERLNNNMLFISGFFNVLADVGFLGYGYLKKKLHPEKKQWEETAAAAAYSTGSIMLFAFGRGDKSDHNARDISLKLREKMLLDGLIIHDEGAVTSFSEAKGGLLHRTYNFLNKHPAELGNASYAIAGGMLAKSALKSDDPKTKFTDSLLGASTMIAGSTAAAVKEKAPDPNAPPPADLIGRAVRWIHIRPNRIAGYGYMVSSFAHGAETIRHLWNAAQDFANPKDRLIAYWAYGLRGVFTVSNLVAEFAMTLASKGSGNGVKSDNSIEETAYAIVSDAINRQPGEERERLIKEYSRNFLADPEIMGGDPAVIEQILRTRVSNLARNPWSKTEDLKQAPVPQAAVQPAVPNWQEKTSLRQTASAQLTPMSV